MCIRPSDEKGRYLMYSPCPDYTTVDTQIAYAKTKAAFFEAVRQGNVQQVKELMNDMFMITDVELFGGIQ
jgi:hypothetical protein